MSKTTSVPGVIRADELYLAAEVCRRLRWRAHAYRQARRAGLRPIKFGRQSYLLGTSVLAFFQELGEKEAGQP